MPTPVSQSGKSEQRRSVLSRRTGWLVLGSLIAVVLLVVGGAVYMRPAARVNRLLTGAGLSRMPLTAENLLAHRRKRFLTTRATYLRFEAPADSIAQFLRDSSMATADGPAPMASLSFGPRCPQWMVWETTAEGRIYHWTLDRTSVWLAVDDESHVVYVGVFESQIPWLRRILN
ncbi:MAG: hypothetical protein JSW27_14960 [Phycisphaerales bacterium]|nr:MAG: hypothetical protein JSW27_14960 [Phycisphaerales bacterium]